MSFKFTLLTPSRYDLHSTFDVLVGSETFSLHTSVFTERSEFFRAARKPEWLAGNPKKLVDPEEDDTEVFSTYINCVYFGSEILKDLSDEWTSSPESDRVAKARTGLRSLLQIYLLADKLQDLATANMVIDELVCFSDFVWQTPNQGDFSFVYRHTPQNSPLRKLMRDYFLHEQNTSKAEKCVQHLNRGLVDDIMLEVLRIKRTDKHSTVDTALKRSAKSKTDKDKCHYHQHDDKHPRCVPKPDAEPDTN